MRLGEILDGEERRSAGVLPCDDLRQEARAQRAVDAPFVSKPVRRELVERQLDEHAPAVVELDAPFRSVRSITAAANALPA